MCTFVCQELRIKTCLMSQDSVVTLSKEKSPLFSQELIKKAAENVQELADCLGEVTFFPHIW